MFGKSGHYKVLREGRLLMRVVYSKGIEICSMNCRR